jgi:hypothetical protein
MSVLLVAATVLCALCLDRLPIVFERLTGVPVLVFESAMAPRPVTLT